MRCLIFLITLFVFSSNALAYEAAPPLTDKEIIETLTELKVGQAGLNKRFDDVNRRFDDVNRHFNDVDRRFDDMNRHFENSFDKLGKRIDRLGGLVLWGFGVIFTGIFALIGFVLWDRRTALAPAVKKNEAIEKALIEYSEKHPDLKKALKHAGLL